MMGQRECQLSWGLNINNIGSKISYGDDYSYFIPTNLRLGLSYMIPINEYNRIAFSADVNKLLVPSMPLKGADEDGQRLPATPQKKTIITSRPSAVSLPPSVTPNAVLRVKWKKSTSVSVWNTYTTRSSLSCGLSS